MYHTVSFLEFLVPFIVEDVLDFGQRDLLLEFHHLLGLGQLNLGMRVHADNLPALLNTRQT